MKNGKKAIKSIISLLILLIFLFQTTSVYAKIDTVKGSPVSTPSDGSTGSYDGDYGPSETDGEEVEIEHTYTTYNIIEGCAYQDFRTKDDKVGAFTTNGKKDDFEPGIPNVKIEAIEEDENGEVEIKEQNGDVWKGSPIEFFNNMENSGMSVKAAYTDEDGNYSVQIPYTGDKKVRLKFTYGYIDNKNYIDDAEGDQHYDKDDIKNILKYNGQDYTASLAGNNRIVSQSYKMDIIRKGKACSQIYIALDCSDSMIPHNEEEEDKLRIVKDAAIQLVDSLLLEPEDLEKEDIKNNIYIGVIGFAGNTYRRLGLSRNKDIIKDAIEHIEELPEGEKNGNPIDWASGTNIKAALNKAESSFATAEGFPEWSDRTLILFSDGAPSICDNEVIYDDDPNPYEHAKIIAGMTNEKFIQLQDDGMSIRAVFPTTGDEEDQLVDILLDKIDVGNTYRPDNLSDLSDKIVYDIEEKIKTQLKITDETEERIGEELVTVDDIERREYVNSQYNTIERDDIENFDIINTFDGTSQDIIDAGNVSEKNYMIVYSNAYNIVRVEDDYPMKVTVNGEEKEVALREPVNQIQVQPYDAGISMITTSSAYAILDEEDFYENYIETIGGGTDGSAAYINQNLALTLREPANVKLDQKVTGVRITLADGRVITDEITNYETDVNLEPGAIIEDLKDVGKGDGLPFIQYLDKELMQGAKIEIEYTIAVNNTSSIQMSGFTLKDYLPDNITFDEDTKMISEDYTNGDYGWNMNDNNIVSMNWHKVDDIKEALKNSYINSNGARYVKLVLSRLATTSNEEMNYTNNVEIIGYSNVDGRFMGEMTSDTTSDGTEIMATDIEREIIPADLSDSDRYSDDGSTLLEQIKAGITLNQSDLQPDETSSLSVMIIPPTGTLEYYVNLAIAVIAFSTIVFIAIAHGLKQDEKLKKDLEHKLK